MEHNEENKVENILGKLIRGKHVNFLIGSGASVPLYPTLKLENVAFSFEEVVTHPDITEAAKYFMYAYYFDKWIAPMIQDDGYKDHDVFKYYQKLVIFFYKYLQNESNERPKRINIFTTNYDLLFERAFDEFLSYNPMMYFNDGSRGVFKRYVSNSNFYLNVTHSGYNDNYRYEVPTVNLFKLHGSVSWKVENDRIVVEENNFAIREAEDTLELLQLRDTEIEKLLEENQGKSIESFVSRLNDYTKDFELCTLKKFFLQYSNLPIINPDKYKFFKTVSEQHYYQLIRSFSYELERKQSVLIVFGFSFADEHLRDIFKRSLLNPELQVIIISYSKNTQGDLKEMFKGYTNIKYLPDYSSDDAKDKKEVKGDFNFLLSLLEGTL